MPHHFKIAVESPSNAGKGMNDENAISNTLNNVDTGITARSEDNENNDNHANDRKATMIDMTIMIRSGIVHIRMILVIVIQTMRRTGITTAMGILRTIGVIARMINIMRMATLIRMIIMSGDNGNSELHDNNDYENNGSDWEPCILPATVSANEKSDATPFQDCRRERPSNDGKDVNGYSVKNNNLNNVDTESTDKSEDNENNVNHANDRTMITADI